MPEERYWWDRSVNPTSVTITPEQYEKEWKPKGWNLIIIGPTSTWRQDWGQWEAIRDIVQNCLDEAEGYSWGRDNEGLWIADKGSGVEISDLLLGPPKLKPEYARGRFGEGLKIACLALLRQNIPVRISTINREIRVIFTEQQVNGRAKVLAAIWKRNGTRTGTRIQLIGYNGHAFEGNFAVNIPRSLILAQTPSTVWEPKQRYNTLYRAEGLAAGGNPGRIYSRDIFLYNIGSPYSYNLWSFPLAPDRHAPAKEEDMYTDIGRTWAGVKSVPLLKEFLRMMLDPPTTEHWETRHISMTWMGTNPTTNRTYSQLIAENKAYWQEAWNAVVGKNTVVRTSDKLDSIVQHLGYKSETLQWGVRDTLKVILQTDKEVVREMSDRLSTAQVIPDSKLTGIQMSHLRLAREIASDFQGLGKVSAAIIPPASDMVGRTAGLYEFGPAAIKIHAEMLSSCRETVGVMVHEIGHHRAYMITGNIAEAGDLTQSHTDSMEYVAGTIFNRLAEGRYDAILKQCSW